MRCHCQLWRLSFQMRCAQWLEHLLQSFMRVCASVSPPARTCTPCTAPHSGHAGCVVAWGHRFHLHALSGGQAPQPACLDAVQCGWESLQQQPSSAYPACDSHVGMLQDDTHRGTGSASFNCCCWGCISKCSCKESCTCHTECRSVHDVEPQMS